MKFHEQAQDQKFVSSAKYVPTVVIESPAPTSTLTPAPPEASQAGTTTAIIPMQITSTATSVAGGAGDAGTTVNWATWNLSDCFGKKLFLFALF